MMRTKTQEAFDYITDTMTGVISFTNLVWFLRAVDSKAAAGDPDAEKVLDVMHRFAKLAEIAQREHPRDH